MQVKSMRTTRDTPQKITQTGTLQDYYLGEQTTSAMATELWQQLPTYIKNLPSYSFPKKLKEY